MERQRVKESFGPINHDFFFLHMPWKKSNGLFMFIFFVENCNYIVASNL